MNTLPFEINTGSNNVGSCDFEVRLGDVTFSSRASYIAQHPLHPLILSVVALYRHIFATTYSYWNAGRSWEILAAREPGGMVIRVTPEDAHLLIEIFDYDVDEAWPTPDNLPDIPAVAEGYVEYWDYAEAVFEAAAKAICRQGVTGFCNTWESVFNTEGESRSVFPMDALLYVAALLKHRRPVDQMSLSEELALLQELMDRFRDQGANAQ